MWLYQVVVGFGIKIVNRKKIIFNWNCDIILRLMYIHNKKHNKIIIKNIAKLKKSSVFKVSLAKYLRKLMWMLLGVVP